ncbi:TonB-linked outer membrane protein, SusC/RagA family [Bacteroidales bacterium WCE2008]|nr:TonB-linked outer membrane protein, SusC/RagA family [Bacteroidales bacterium WCE2008]
MKLYTKTVIIVITFLFISISAGAQTITGKWNGQDIKTVLKGIEDQTGLSIFYRSDEVDENATYTGEFQNTPVEKALKSILGGDTAVTINGKMIVLSKSNKTAQQKGIVHGTILDSYGVPVPGAGIFVKGTSKGVSSDLNGQFSIEAGPGTVLTISSLGYKSVEYTVRNSAAFTITLEDENEMLEELVVVGYGSQKKVNLTGSVSVVKADELKDRSSLDVAHMLQGTVPGLNVTSSSGRPGQAATLNIRGLNSINGGSPLVLIDGAEGDMQYLNPADVESISVIKDAAAAAIYGSKGSAGVILITTKNGSKEKEGKATLHYSGRYGVTAPTTSTDWETRGYYSVYLNNLFWNAYSPGTQYATYSEQDMQELWIRRNDKTENPARPWVVIDQRSGQDTYNYYANTDWWHELYNDIKPTTSHSISLTGATSHVNYLISGGYTGEQGMFKENPDMYKRYNLRMKVGTDITSWLKIGNNISYFHSSYSYPGQSGINNNFGKSTAHALASYPAKNPDGTSPYLTQYNGYTIMDGLPMLLDNHNINSDSINNVSDTFDVTITPTEGLTIKADYTYAFQDKKYSNRATNGVYSKVPGVIEKISTGVFEDKLTEAVNSYTYKAANAYATYQHVWNDAHDFKVMAGVNYETKLLKDISGIGYYLYSDTLNDLNLTGSVGDEGNKRTEVTGGQNEYITTAYFTRINYNYKGRYLVEVNARRDGTSRFARGHRWVISPSFSLGWRISEEPFFAPLKSWWDNLKIRASYGQLGNQQMSEYYPTIRVIDTSGKSSYLLGGAQLSTASISAPTSSKLTWERSVQKNVGVDMSLLKGRLEFLAEGYIRDTKDMLSAGVPLPATYGYSTAPKENNADLSTSGYEIAITWKDSFRVDGKPFNYSVGLNFSDYTSRITRFNNPEKLFAKKYWEGQKYGDIWGYHIDGIFASDEEAAAYPVDQSIVNDLMTGGLMAGDLKFADLDGDKKINKGSEKVGDSGDWRVIGNKQPRYNYGINLGASWNGFDFSAFFQGIGHIDWYPAPDARSFWGPFARPYQTFIPKNFHNTYWTEEHTDAYFPRPRGYVAMNTNRELGIANDRYLQNIGYLRLKNLTIGYSLPAKLLQKISVSKLRLYFTGENLFYYAPGLHSDYIDPEMAMTDGNLRIYPWQKTLMFGIDITI